MGTLGGLTIMIFLAMAVILGNIKPIESSNKNRVLLERRFSANAAELRPKYAVARADGKNYLRVVSTAYYAPLPNQSQYAHGVGWKAYVKDMKLNGRGIATYTGKRPKVGHIAADPRVLPFGTVVRIPGYGVGVVEDMGEDIKGHRIDLFMGHGEKGLLKAVSWGKKPVVIEVLEGGRTS